MINGTIVLYEHQNSDIVCDTIYVYFSVYFLSFYGYTKNTHKTQITRYLDIKSLDVYTTTTRITFDYNSLQYQELKRNCNRKLKSRFVQKGVNNNIFGITPFGKSTYQPMFQSKDQTVQWKQIQQHHILLHTAVSLAKY
jgi:hypothetical protein